MSVSSISSDFDPRNSPNNTNIRLHRMQQTGFINPDMERQTDRIVEKMQQDDTLMEDTPVSEQMRKEALRDLPQTLTVKRCVKMKLSKSVSQKSKHRPISMWTSFKYRTSISFRKFIGRVKNFNYFELWQGTLKDIEGRFGSGYASYFKFLRWLLVMNFCVAVVSFVFLVLPQIMYDINHRESNTNETTFNFDTLFLGNGFFLDTVLYYGHYTSNFIELVPNWTFNMQAAYFALMVVLYLASFVALAVSVAESYRRSYVESEGGLQNAFANKVFCGWDFAIATKEAATLKSSAIYNELKELLSESLEPEMKRSCLYKFWTVMIQLVVHIFSLVIFIGVGWATWELLNKNEPALTAIATNVIIMIFPPVFNYIANYEDYKNPKTVLYITLTRTFLLGLVIVGVIVAYWLIHSTHSDNNCWENSLGSEIYRLVVFDFIFSVLVAVLLDLLLVAFQCIIKRDFKSEFNIAKHTLQVIYNQGLFWVGFYYSPLLPVAVTLKMLIIWYVREWSVRKFCKPPKRTWRAAQAQTWFMMMIFVSNLLIIATHGYTLTSVATSQCGPFSAYNYTYELVTNDVVDLEQNEIWGIIMNVTKPGGVALIMIALSILVYLLREQAQAKREKVKVLREMLVWVAKDKKVLMQWYNDAIRGNIDIHNIPDTRHLDPSLTSRHSVAQDVSFQSHHLHETGAGSSGLASHDDLNSRFKVYN